MRELVHRRQDRRSDCRGDSGVHSDCDVSAVIVCGNRPTVTDVCRRCPALDGRVFADGLWFRRRRHLGRLVRVLIVLPAGHPETSLPGQLFYRDSFGGIVPMPLDGDGVQGRWALTHADTEDAVGLALFEQLFENLAHQSATLRFQAARQVAEQLAQKLAGRVAGRAVQRKMLATLDADG